MHEVSIAQNILDTACSNCLDKGYSSVTRVVVAVGRLSGVEGSSLKFAFDALKEGTVAENAHMDIDFKEIVGLCLDCGTSSEYQDIKFICPTCESVNIDLKSGEELEVKYLEVD